MNSIITKTDSYKLNHWNQYPENTEVVYSYFESRKGARFEKTPFFGLQYILMKYLQGVVVTQEAIDFADRLSVSHFGDRGYFNKAGWQYILDNCGGKLPLRIKAVPEGTPVTVSNVLMTVENTDEKCGWLTNYVESLLTHVWYTSTVCALSRTTKQMYKEYLNESSDNGDACINFMLHDFGYRGTSSDESAKVGGMAHLVNFLGTDTVVSMEAAMEYYNADMNGLAYSVAATEHSVMTARGRDGEAGILDQLLLNYPKGILSVVSDSYDIYNFVENLVCKQFKDRIEKRDGVFVVRPDSNTPKHPNPEDQVVWILQTLANAFGYTTNTKGYMVLNPKVRVIWGDGIDMAGIDKIIEAAINHSFSAENLLFGMGGGLLQKVNRDTNRYAFKCAAQKRNGQWHDVYKEPKDLSKVSKKGRMKLIKENGEFKTVRIEDDGEDLLKVVFENGELVNPITFAEARENAKV